VSYESRGQILSFDEGSRASGIASYAELGNEDKLQWINFIAVDLSQPKSEGKKAGFSPLNPPNKSIA